MWYHPLQSKMKRKSHVVLFCLLLQPHWYSILVEKTQVQKDTVNWNHVHKRIPTLNSFLGQKNPKNKRKGASFLTFELSKLNSVKVKKKANNIFDIWVMFAEEQHNFSLYRQVCVRILIVLSNCESSILWTEQWICHSLVSQYSSIRCATLPV